MKHTLYYMGRFSKNFARLSSAKSDYIDLKGNVVPCENDSPSIDGLRFGYMQKSHSEFFAVKIGDVALENPVELVPSSHCDGKGFGPIPSHFGDQSAQTLLADMLRMNPKQTLEIVREAWTTIASA